MTISYQSTLRFGLASAALALIGCGQKQTAHVSAPPDVDIVTVEQQDVPTIRQWVATMDGLVNAQVRAQVSGYLLRQGYRSGDFVRRGAPLFDIDRRPFEAVAKEAEANVAQAESRLKQAQSDLQNAHARRGKTQLDVARSKPLAEERAISRQELDDAVQADLAAVAGVGSAEAAIVTAKAAIEAAKARLQSARLNLNFATVTSPIDGIAGINNAQIGDLVGPQSAALTTVSTVDPILVIFSVAEQDYLSVGRRLAVAGTTEQNALGRLEFSLQLTDGSTYPHKGRIHAVNREVDVKTGSIVVQTAFPNPNNMLRPGGFGRVSTVAGIERGAILVPERAIADVQGVHLVAVVNKSNTVKLQPVELGAAAGNKRVVSKGLRPGDRVVVEGIQKVRDGVRVNPTQREASHSG